MATVLPAFSEASRKKENIPTSHLQVAAGRWGRDGSAQCGLLPTRGSFTSLESSHPKIGPNLDTGGARARQYRREGGLGTVPSPTALSMRIDDTVVSHGSTHV